MSRNKLAAILAAAVTVTGVAIITVASRTGIPSNEGATPRQGEAYDRIASAFNADDVDVSLLIGKVRDVRFDYRESQNARNPMVPLVGVSPLVDDLDPPEFGGTLTDEDRIYLAHAMALTGVVWDDSPFAILDDILVWEGFTFYSGISVKEIRATELVLDVPLADGTSQVVLRRFAPDEDET